MAQLTPDAQAWRLVLAARSAHGESLSVDELRWLAAQEAIERAAPRRPSQRPMVEAAIRATRTRPARGVR